MKQYHVYILTNRPRGTLYIGVTGDLIHRIHAHRTGAIEGFTKRYRLHRLVHIETTPDVRAAIQREKTLKRWLRAWKIALIEAHNPEWRDLWYDIVA